VSAPDPRIEAVVAILAREGIEGRIAVAGHARDVAAITAAPAQLARLTGVAPEIKALGFRYVALELPEETERA
jgi:hypothetical protein